MAAKWSGPDGKPRKGIYHSYLVREPGIMVKLKGDVRQSKFADKPPFIALQVPDDDNEYLLNVEPECEQAFKDAPKGVWLRCTARGGKDQPNSVIFADETGPILPAGLDPDDWEPVNDAPQSGPPPMWPEDDRKEAKLRNRDEPTKEVPASKVAYTRPQPTTANALPNGMNQTMWACWQNAVSLVRADFPEATADAGVEAASRIANTLYIAASK